MVEQVGIKIELKDPEDFLKCKESLTRIGVATKKEKKLIQSVHLLHKKGHYYLVHFKELFILDGKPSSFSDDDRLRRNLIAHLLHEWGLVNVLNMDEIKEKATPGSVKVLSFKEKDEWQLCSKYTLGTGR